MALIRPKEAVEARLHEIGRVFKGSKKRDREKNGKSYQIMGEDLDYFRFEPAESTKLLPAPSGDDSLYDYLAQQWVNLGFELKAISVQFLYEDVASNFDHEYNELWARVGNAERCTRRCNGETVVLSLDGKKLSREPLACSAAVGDDECPLGCKPVGRLKFVIPGLGYMGLVVMTTHSIYDILELSGNLAFYDGKLAGLPFNLCRSERSVIHDGMGMKKSLCHLAIDPRFGQAFMAAAPKAAMKEIAGDSEVIEAVVIEQPSLPAAKDLGAEELVATKKLFMDLIKEKGITDIKTWVAANISDIPSIQWSIDDWIKAVDVVSNFTRKSGNTLEE